MKFLTPILLLLTVQFTRAQSTLDLEDIMKGADFVGHLPEGVYWSTDSRTIYFEWNRDSLPGTQKYQYVLGSETPRLLSDQEIINQVPAYGIYSKDRQKRLFHKNGDLFLQELPGDSIKQITNTLQHEIARGFSGDEGKIVFQMNDNLYTWSLADGVIEQLTQFKKGSEKPDEELNDKKLWLKRDQLEYFEILQQRDAEDKFEEEKKKKFEPKRPKEIYLNKDNLTNISFSPDLRFITFQRQTPVPPDPTLVPDYVTVSGYTRDLPARSKVGGEESTYKTVIYDRLRDTLLEIDLKQIPGIYLKPDFMKDYYKGSEAYIDTFENPRPVVIQSPLYNENGTHSVVVIRSQDNKDRWIMKISLEDGILKLIDHQRDEAWIGGPGIGGSHMSTGNIGFIDEETLWYQSEKTGYSHIYIYHFKNGKTEALTQGNFEILDATLSLDKKTFLIYSNKKNPFEHHFYHLSVENGNMTKVTSRTGDNQVFISPDEEKLAILYSYSNQPTELFWMENKPGAEMQVITASTTEAFKQYAWRDPQIIHFKARDGVMVPARIYKPERKRKNGAAVIFVHGAGYLHNVHKYWSSYFREFMFHNFLADHGYTVLDIDYRGSAGYGRDWRTAIYRFMGGKDLDDQLDGAAYLVKEEGINADRLGIYGGSYGGFITLMALCTSPGTFRCGAALRSVTDWAHYNHGYTSNILNTPVEDSIAYYRSSPIYHAEGLEGDLLMLHGMVDRNVHFQDVVRMSQRFIEFGKENWELAVFPMEDHGFVESSSWTDEYKRIFRLFEKNLRK